MLNFRRKKSAGSEASARQDAVVVDAPRQPFRKAIVPVIACGAGLFSDGYINNVSPPSHMHLRGPVRSVCLGSPGPWLASAKVRLSGDESLVFFCFCLFLSIWLNRRRSSAPSPPSLPCSTATCTRTQTPRSTSATSPLPAPSLASWPLDGSRTTGRAPTRCSCRPSSWWCSPRSLLGPTTRAMRLACSTSWPHGASL